MTNAPQQPKVTSPPLNLTPYVSSQRARQATVELLESTESTSTATEEVSTARRSSFLEQDEGVLMDVLQELDRERHKRAELEARVRVLEREVHIQRRKSSKSNKTSMREYALVKTERDGFKEILDALTQDRPAFSTSSCSNQKNRLYQPRSLPIHIVRLLEVMPWDSRAQQYAFGQEQVYEWQIYSADKKWLKDLRNFPTFFKTLPIVVPTPGKTMSDEASKSQSYFGVTISPPRQCVLTDLDGSTILNIDKGYPLPDDGGGWTWVGPWKVEKNNDTDEQGWTYSNEIEVMSDLTTYHGGFRAPEKGTANITKRRRKWTRPRTLIDYPYISNMTREYLKLIAERSRLNTSVEKLSGQLVDTKMSLTSIEAEKERSDARINELDHELNYKNEILGLVENGEGLKLSNIGLADNILRISDASSKSFDSAKKVDEIRSAVTQWVSNTVQKQLQYSNEENTNKLNSIIAISDNANVSEANSDHSAILSNVVEKSTAMTEQAQQRKQQDPKQQLFESLRDKGTGFFEILKQKGEQLDKMKQGSGGSGVGLRWQRKEESNSSSNKDNNENDGSLSSTISKPNMNVPPTGVRFHSNGNSN